MAFVHKSKEDALKILEEWISNPLVVQRGIQNLKTSYYTNSDIEFILEAFDGNTNHVIENENGKN